MARRIDTVVCFDRYFLSWRIIGLLGNEKNNQLLWRLYDIVLTIFVTICFPLHLFVGTIRSESAPQFFNNIVICTAAVSCSIKHFFYRLKLQQIKRVCDIFETFDERVQSTEEIRYFKREMSGPCKFMTNFFYYSYGSVSILGITIALVTRELIYPAYIPFDWQASSLNYVIAVVYQFIGLSLQIVENLSNDLYGPLVLCMLSGHVHLLCMRLASIGHAPTADGISKEEEAKQNYKALITCFEDYRLLRSTAGLVEEIVKLSYLVQFIAVGFNICVCLVALLFIADGPLGYAYFCVHLTTILIELFPCCYYGSMLEYNFKKLPYAIFSSNWPMQPRLFRRTVVLFTEQSLRDLTLYAGGMIRIHLDSFFATCKMAYSFFTVMQGMK